MGNKETSTKLTNETRVQNKRDPNQVLQGLDWLNDRSRSLSIYLMPGKGAGKSFRSGQAWDFPTAANEQPGETDELNDIKSSQPDMSEKK